MIIFDAFIRQKGSVFITAKDAKGAKEGKEGIDKNPCALRVLRGLV
jgi:hypothetical protein